MLFLVLGFLLYLLKVSLSEIGNGKWFQLEIKVLKLNLIETILSLKDFTEQVF